MKKSKEDEKSLMLPKTMYRSTAIHTKFLYFDIHRNRLMYIHHVTTTALSFHHIMSLYYRCIVLCSFIGSRSSGFFQLGSIVNKGVMNVCIQTFVRTCYFLPLGKYLQEEIEVVGYKIAIVLFFNFYLNFFIQRIMIIFFLSHSFSKILPTSLPTQIHDLSIKKSQ